MGHCPLHIVTTNICEKRNSLEQSVTHTHTHDGTSAQKIPISFSTIFGQLCNSRRIGSPWLYTVESMSEFGLDSLYMGTSSGKLNDIEI